MTDTNFQIFLKIPLTVMVKVVDLALRAFIDSFQTYTINSLNEKQNFETNFIMSKASIGVAQPKKKKNKKYYYYY